MSSDHARSHKMTHSLITGGAGFIGSHLADALVARGQRVTVVDNLSTGAVENLEGLQGNPLFRFVEGSITDGELLGKLVAEADHVYHLAAAVGVKLVADDPVHTIETNIYPTELLLGKFAEACRRHVGGVPGSGVAESASGGSDARSEGHHSASGGRKLPEGGPANAGSDPALLEKPAVAPDSASAQPAHAGRSPNKRLFLASTSEVYGKNPKERFAEDDDMVFGPTTKARWAYGCSKAIDEFLGLAYCRQFGLPVVVGRFFNVVGPRQVGQYGMVVPRFVEQALAGGPVVVYDDGRQVRSFAHVADVVRAVTELMHCDAAGGQVFNIGSDRPVTIRELAEAVVQLVDPVVKIEHLAYDRAYGSGFEDVRRRVPDLTRLRNSIGYEPQYELRDILREIIESKS
jgi:nucleoside-diphosphate-sugar epimerase